MPIKTPQTLAKTESKETTKNDDNVEQNINEFCEYVQTDSNEWGLHRPNLLLGTLQVLEEDGIYTSTKHAIRRGIFKIAQNTGKI